MDRKAGLGLEDPPTQVKQDLLILDRQKHRILVDSQAQDLVLGQILEAEGLMDPDSAEDQGMELDQDLRMELVQIGLEMGNRVDVTHLGEAEAKLDHSVDLEGLVDHSADLAADLVLAEDLLIGVQELKEIRSKEGQGETLDHLAIHLSLAAGLEEVLATSNPMAQGSDFLMGADHLDLALEGDLVTGPDQVDHGINQDQGMGLNQNQEPDLEQVNWSKIQDILWSNHCFTYKVLI